MNSGLNGDNSDRAIVASWNGHSQQTEQQPKFMTNVFDTLTPSTSMSTLSSPLKDKGEKRDRMRTSQACQACRERKRKCTGQKPTCGRCTDRGLQCIWNTIVPQRHRHRQRPRPHPHPQIKRHNALPPLKIPYPQLLTSTTQSDSPSRSASSPVSPASAWDNGRVINNINNNRMYECPPLPAEQQPLLSASSSANSPNSILCEPTPEQVPYPIMEPFGFSMPSKHSKPPPSPFEINCNFMNGGQLPFLNNNTSYPIFFQSSPIPLGSNDNNLSDSCYSPSNNFVFDFNYNFSSFPTSESSNYPNHNSYASITTTISGSTSLGSSNTTTSSSSTSLTSPASPTSPTPPSTTEEILKQITKPPLPPTISMPSPISADNLLYPPAWLEILDAVVGSSLNPAPMFNDTAINTAPPALSSSSSFKKQITRNQGQDQDRRHRHRHRHQFPTVPEEAFKSPT